MIASEAFIATTFDRFITSDIVLKARKEKIEPYGPLIVGVDPAGKGADRTAIAFRRGHCIEKIRGAAWAGYNGGGGLGCLDHPRTKPTKVNIDVGGLGVGVYDRLIEQGYGSDVVNAVNFGGKPIELPPLDETGKPAGGPANRRAELWTTSKKVLQGRLSIPTPTACTAI